MKLNKILEKQAELIDKAKRLIGISQKEGIHGRRKRINRKVCIFNTFKTKPCMVRRFRVRLDEI